MTRFTRLFVPVHGVTDFRSIASNPKIAGKLALTTSCSTKIELKGRVPSGSSMELIDSYTASEKGNVV